jgi:hypothetical protein
VHLLDLNKRILILKMHGANIKIKGYTVYLYLETALHVSGGTCTHHQERIQLSTASDMCHTIIAICRYCGRVGTGLSVLWVAYATHSTLKPVPTVPR